MEVCLHIDKEEYILKNGKGDVMNLPYAVIERAKKYRVQANGDWGSWCDGDKINEGHFQGLEVQSILADGVEVKLCKDCRQSFCRGNMGQGL